MRLTEQSFDAGPISINYATNDGAGPPVVLLHGLTDRWQSLLPLVQALDSRWRVFAPDMRGHGRSGRSPTGVYLHTDLAADVVALAESVVGEPAVFIGHSAGAFPAMEVAARHPELSRGVIVGDMMFDLEHLERLTSTPESTGYYCALRHLAGQPAAEIADRLSVLRADLEPSVRSAMAIALEHVDPRVVDCHAEGRFLDLFEDFDGDDLLDRIAAPTLLIQADPELGAVLTDRYVSHALGLLSDGSHVRLDGADHNLGLDRGSAEPLTRAVAQFLESLPAA
ncbi:MAG: alpha/beta hydrolase [Acidimicrobiia bacterium]|nr:alpha/beta hydrolase [Acidimicrobiia bacterium]